MVRLDEPKTADDIVGNVVIDARVRGWGLDIDVLVVRASCRASVAPSDPLA